MRWQLNNQALINAFLIDDAALKPRALWWQSGARYQKSPRASTSARESKWQEVYSLLLSSILYPQKKKTFMVYDQKAWILSLPGKSSIFASLRLLRDGIFLVQLQRGSYQCEYWYHQSWFLDHVPTLPSLWRFHAPRQFVAGFLLSLALFLQ